MFFNVFLSIFGNGSSWIDIWDYKNSDHAFRPNSNVMYANIKANITLLNFLNVLPYHSMDMNHLKQEQSKLWIKKDHPELYIRRTQTESLDTESIFTPEQKQRSHHMLQYWICMIYPWNKRKLHNLSFWTLL